MTKLRGKQDDTSVETPVETQVKPEPQTQTRDWSGERTELSELNDKRTRLSQFMEGDVFAQLNGGEQDQLRRQHRAMSDYAQVLDERLATKPI